jgi:hypothetical protein
VNWRRIRTRMFMACFMSLTKHAEVFARSAHSMMEPALQKVDSLIKD